MSEIDSTMHLKRPFYVYPVYTMHHRIEYDFTKTTDCTWEVTDQSRGYSNVKNTPEEAHALAGFLNCETDH